MTKGNVKKNRVEIPPNLAARILFLSDRTCCVCRAKGKSIQIHHIDENPANNTLGNLAVLCLECHSETQVIGGFRRKLDAEQIILYREDWILLVARERASTRDRIKEADSGFEGAELELATSIAEIYRDERSYELLALHYMIFGNDELRDKYIDLAIQEGIDDETLIYLRSTQNRPDLIPEEIIKRQVARLERRRDRFALGRLYRGLRDHPEAVMAICKAAVDAISKGNMFSAAFYLKEMVSEGDVDRLFEMAFEDARSRGDLWWQYRALQELGLYTEAQALILEHHEAIRAGGEMHFLQELALAERNYKDYVRLRKDEARAETETSDGEMVV